MRQYYDFDGQECTLRTLIAKEPEWAFNRIRRCEELETETERLKAENEEQARLLGMSGEREAKLLAEIERLEADYA